MTQSSLSAAAVTYNEVAQETTLEQILHELSAWETCLQSLLTPEATKADRDGHTRQRLLQPSSLSLISTHTSARVLDILYTRLFLSETEQIRKHTRERKTHTTCGICICGIALVSNTYITKISSYFLSLLPTYCKALFPVGSWTKRVSRMQTYTIA